ncbi:MAG: hypothetical protein WCB91_00220, partial [Halobacteriota archaeon]
FGTRLHDITPSVEPDADAELVRSSGSSFEAHLCSTSEEHFHWQANLTPVALRSGHTRISSSEKKCLIPTAISGSL